MLKPYPGAAEAEVIKEFEVVWLFWILFKVGEYKVPMPGLKLNPILDWAIAVWKIVRVEQPQINIKYRSVFLKLVEFIFIITS